MQRADKRKYHYIYKITRDDGRFYIGMHSTDNLEDGYFGSGKLITRSIKKYGYKIHKKEILEFLESRNLLKERERQLVTEEMVTNKQCMNLVLGGNGGCSINSQRIRSTAGGKAFSKRLENNVEFKKYFSDKMSAINLEQYKNGRVAKGCFADNSSVIKKAWSDEARIKRNSTRQANGFMQGSKNSQFGIKRIGISKDSIIKKILPEQLQEFLDDGWKKGFKN